MEMGMLIITGTGFFVHKGIIFTVTRVEYISERLLYVTLRGCWCDMVLNVHVSTEDYSDDIKDSFYDN
jgi:hypothetical protein